MNRFDLRFAAITFCIGVTLILILTPWERTFSQQGAATVERPAMHFPITMPPDPRRPTDYRQGVRIDLDRLGLYLLLVIGASILVGTLDLRE